MIKPPPAKTPPWDRIEPKTASGKFALELLRDVIGDDWRKLPESVQLRVEQAPLALDADERQHQHGKQANKQEYNYWIDSISRTIIKGERPENLLTDFMSELNKLMQNDKSDALFAILLEEIEDDTGKKGFELLRSVGLKVRAGHWQEFKQELRKLGNRPFLRNALHNQNDLEVRLARYADYYGGELDSLVKVSRGKARQESASAMEILDRFWISSIALTADQAPPRCLMIAYENTGDEIRPNPAQGAAEEWRVLFYLRIAYNQLNFRIRDLPRYVATQRKLWIRELAPSVLAHEAAAQTNIIADSATQATSSFLNLLKQKPELEESLGSSVVLLRNVVESATNLNRTFSTYLNLQRKNQIEQFELGQIFEEAWELCRQRLSGIEVAISKDSYHLPLLTDRSLLSLVLTNLLANATRAINEGKWPNNLLKGENKILLSAENISEKEAHLVLANSGPPILQEQTGRIFEQGFSSYADGYGQGLFVCRLICQHLGGSLVLTDAKPYGDEFNVAFLISITPQLTQLSGANL